MGELKLGYLNYVVLMGRLTQDPDLRYTPKGNPVCNMRIAVSRRFRDKESGEIKEEASFFNVVAFKRQAELAGDYLKKGSAVLIEGRLRSRSWETDAGEKRYTVEILTYRIQFLDKIPQEPAETQAEEETDVPKEEIKDIPF